MDVSVPMKVLEHWHEAVENIPCLFIVEYAPPQNRAKVLIGAFGDYIDDFMAFNFGPAEIEDGQQVWMVKVARGGKPREKFRSVPRRSRVEDFYDCRLIEI